MTNKPVAYSQKYYHKQALRASRLLGIPNVIWCGLAMGVASGGLPLVLKMTSADFLDRYGVLLLAGGVALWGLLRWLMPSRDEVAQFAAHEHRNEVARVALAHRVGLSDVRCVDSEAERQAAEQGD